MATIRKWSEKHDASFEEAVAAIAEDLADGGSFEHSLQHYADLFQIESGALRHEWNLRKEDSR
jgi:hypothetical protein